MKIEITEHPSWVEAMIEEMRPWRERIESHPHFLEAAAGSLAIGRIQTALVHFYPLVESFPEYMALTLAKVPPGGADRNRTARRWLMSNINVEREHGDWWRQWAVGFGVASEIFETEIRPPAAIDAINNYLRRVCREGSLAEAVAATNYAVEGPTGQWTQRVKQGLRQYHGRGVAADARTLRWIERHADYDDSHPHEALEIVKAHATTKQEQERVKFAARRAVEYYAMALDACREAC